MRLVEYVSTSRKDDLLSTLLSCVCVFQAVQQMCVYVNDRLVKTADSQLHLDCQPIIVASEHAVLVLDASAMHVCCPHLAAVTAAH